MRRIISLAIIVFVLVMAAKHDPTETQYQHWLKGKAESMANNKIEKGAIAMFGNTAIEQNTVVHDYIFFSLYKTTFHGHHVVAVGAFDHFVPLPNSK